MSEPSLSLVLPSDPVDVVDDVESLPDTFGFASAAELLVKHKKQMRRHWAGECLTFYFTRNHVSETLAEMFLTQLRVSQFYHL